MFDQKSSSYTKFHKRQHDRKGWNTLLSIFEKIVKILKMKSQEWKNIFLVFIYKFVRKKFNVNLQENHENIV